MRTNDSHEIVAPEVTLRIPGTWSRPEEFYEGLPRGSRCTAEGLVMADGSEFELHVLPADEEFPRIFAGSCPKLLRTMPHPAAFVKTEGILVEPPPAAL
ncbi:MAG: hypothetical protein WD738_05415 [Pirellulales bacterium]